MAATGSQRPLIVPIRQRVPFIFVDRGKLAVDGHCLLVRREDSDLEIPVGMVSVILLEPGVTVTHEAVKLAAEEGVLLLWVGEAGVRLYSAGLPGGGHASRLLGQAAIRLDPALRLRAAQRLYMLMFGGGLPESRSIERLRGFEGAW